MRECVICELFSLCNSENLGLISEPVLFPFLLL